MNWTFKITASISHKDGDIETINTTVNALDYNHVISNLQKVFEEDIHEDVEATEININIKQ